MSTIDGGPGNIVTNGLVLYLDAANVRSYPTNGTIWTDLSGNGNNGTLTNGPTFNSGNGGSIVFDGVNDYVNLSASTSYNIPGDYTLELWINAASTANRQVISSRWNTDPKSYYVAFFPSGFISHYRTLANNTHYNAGFAFTPSDFLNKWNQLVAITSGSTIQIWNNGVLKASTAWPGVVSVPNESLILGTLSTEIAQAFNGRISNTRIYNRALSATEVLQNFNATRARFGI